MYESLKGKRLLVLGGTRISCEIIKCAKKLGLIVGVADYNKLEDSPGKQIADEKYDVSVTDVDAVVDLLKREKFDGVITGFSDMLLPYYADICKKSGLYCYGTKEQFELFSDKKKYKELCKKFNVPVIKDYNDKNLKKTEEYPVIVKPSDGSGSKGITICNCFDELEDAIKKAKSFSKKNSIIIEKYMSEQEATVNWVFVDGEYYLSCICDRYVKKLNDEKLIPLPVGHFYPSTITNKYINETMLKVKEMFKSIGIKNGIMFMQCKVDNGVCRVYDMGFRLTGALEYKNLEMTCGYNPLEMLINYSITGKMCDESLLNKINPINMKPSFNVSFISEPGEISKITGLEKIGQTKGINDIVLAHLPGEIIKEDLRGLLAQVTVSVFGYADDKKQMIDLFNHVQNTIHIISKEGKDMCLRKMEREDFEILVK